jgi:hypothetical protein
MALAIATVTNSIAALSVSGLTIKDIDEIPSSAVGRNLPIMFPNPAGFVNNFDAQKATTGEGVNSKWDVSYELNYLILYAASGAGRGLELFAPTVSLAFAVMDAVMICNPIAGAVLLRPGTIGVPGAITDPSGGEFYGVQVSFRVLEFVG